jgi:TctA family transporter
VLHNLTTAGISIVTTRGAFPIVATGRTVPWVAMMMVPWMMMVTVTVVFYKMLQQLICFFTVIICFMQFVVIHMMVFVMSVITGFHINHSL